MPELSAIHIAGRVAPITPFSSRQSNGIFLSALGIEHFDRAARGAMQSYCPPVDNVGPKTSPDHRLLILRTGDTV